MELTISSLPFTVVSSNILVSNIIRPNLYYPESLSFLSFTFSVECIPLHPNSGAHSHIKNIVSAAISLCGTTVVNAMS